MDIRPSWLLSLTLWLGVFLLPVSASAQEAHGAEIEVDCDTGQTLTQALEEGQPGATIRVTGTCAENIVVTTDGLTLDGQGTAVLDGANDGVTLTIDGARDVTVTGFTVQNGQHGILGLRLATFTVSDTLIRENRAHGIEVTHAAVEVTNVTSEDNGRAGVIVNRNALLTLTDSIMRNNLTGLVLYNNASARLEGTNVMSENATQGFTVGLGAVVFSIGSTISLVNNGEEGMLVLQSGNMELLGGQLEVLGNAGDGIKVEQLSSITMGIEAFEVPGEVLIEGNQGNGLSVLAGSNVRVSQIMPLTSRGNGAAGLRVDNGSTVEVGGSTLQDNDGPDVELSFGSQATMNGNTVGGIVCDETSVSRGTTTCP